jgi:hypothetical protein
VKSALYSTAPFPSTPDFDVEGDGSIWLFRPLTAEARAQVNAILQDQDNAQTFGGALVVEHRYVGALVEQLAELGYRIRVL